MLYICTCVVSHISQAMKVKVNFEFEEVDIGSFPERKAELARVSKNTTVCCIPVPSGDDDLAGPASCD